MPIKKEQLQISEQELEQMVYEDALVMFNSYMEQKGARRVLQDFKQAFPQMFEEVMVQGDRLISEPRKAALLR